MSTDEEVAGRQVASEPEHGHLAIHQDVAARVEREVERIESTAIEFAQMRAAHLVASGMARVSETEVFEAAARTAESMHAAAAG